MKRWIIAQIANPAAALLGCLLTLAFAPYNLFPLGILAPAGLLALWLKAAPGQAFWRGFWFGIGLFATGVYWLYHSIHNIGGVPAPLALFITAGFIAILALFPAICGFIITRYFPFNNHTKLLCAFPAIWTLSDWFRTLLFTGFPWLFIGYTQINSPLRGYASVSSVYGVTIAALMTSGLIVNIFLLYKQKCYRSLYFCLLGTLAIWTGGAVLNMIQWTKPQGAPESIALVQGNIPQTLKWSPEYLQLSLNRYRELTEPLFGKARIIIWPEAAVTVPYEYAEDYIRAENQKAKESGSQLLLGIPIKSPDGSGYFNSVITLGSVNQRYDKRHLVPFGEYTPQIPFLNQALNILNIPMSDATRGSMDQTPLTVDNIKILVNICYEIAYPELIRSDAVDDASLGFILTVTNDAWFGKSNAQAQHLQMAQMRALESGRPVVFVSNDGITAIINANGDIAAQAPPYQSYVLQGNVQPVHGVTPWMMTYGNASFKYIIIVFLLFSIRSAVIERRLSRRKQPAVLDILNE